MNDFYRVSWFKGNDSLWTWLRNVLKEILMLSKNLHPCPQRHVIKRIVLKHVQGRGMGSFSPYKVTVPCVRGEDTFHNINIRSFNTGDIFICEWVHRNHSSKCIWKDQPLGLFVFTADGLLVKKMFYFRNARNIDFFKRYQISFVRPCKKLI